MISDTGKDYLLLRSYETGKLHIPIITCSYRWFANEKGNLNNGVKKLLGISLPPETFKRIWRGGSKNQLRLYQSWDNWRTCHEGVVRSSGFEPMTITEYNLENYTLSPDILGKATIQYIQAWRNLNK